MSFFLTQVQFRNRSKTVTRRLGWHHVKVGDLIQGCVKCQGLKPGEQIEKLGVIEVVDVRIEPLNAITPEDVIKEGFPGMTPVRIRGNVYGAHGLFTFFTSDSD